MKNKWGLGITIFYSLFVIAMVSFVFYSRGVNIDLVRDDYYQGDIEFQGKLEKLKNARKLSRDLRINMDNNTNEVVLDFPKNIKSISGDIKFYRASDKRLDFNLPIELLKDNIQRIPMSVKNDGLWKVNVDWKGDDTAYFKEEEIFK